MDLLFGNSEAARAHFLRTKSLWLGFTMLINSWHWLYLIAKFKLCHLFFFKEIVEALQGVDN